MSKDKNKTKNKNADTFGNPDGTQEEKQDKPIVKVPTSKVGRAIFAGTQVASALSAARSLRAARRKGDKLALVHALLNTGMLVVTVLVAVRTVRETKQAEAARPAAPLMLTDGK